MKAIENSELQSLHKQYELLKAFSKDEKILDLGDNFNFESLQLLIKAMLETLDKLLDTVDLDSSCYNRLLAMKASVIYEEANIYAKLGDEGKTVETLGKSLSIIEQHILRQEVTEVALRIINRYAVMQFRNGSYNKARLLLENAEDKYKQLRPKLLESTFCGFDQLFWEDSEMPHRKDEHLKVQWLSVHNLQILSYVYNKLGKLRMFVRSYHEALKRQLESTEGDTLVWAVKSARLASFFLLQQKFKEARHHLAAATHVLEEYEVSLKEQENSDTYIEKCETLRQRGADVANTWVKYGLSLFALSRSRYIELSSDTDESVTSFSGSASKDTLPRAEAEPRNDGQDDIETKTSEAEEPDKTTTASMQLEGETRDNTSSDALSHQLPQSFGDSEPMKCNTPFLEEDERGSMLTNTADGDFEDVLKFPLELDELEQRVSCEPVESLDQAKALFHFTHGWLQRSKKFYSLKNHPFEYVNIVLDLAELYKFLAFYEEDIDGQYLIHKRRADSLETLMAVLKELRPQCYTAVNVELLRQLAETQLEMMSINLRRLYLSENMSIEPFLQKMEAISDTCDGLSDCSDVIDSDVFQLGVPTEDM